MVIFEKAARNVNVARLESFARQAKKLAGVEGEVSVLLTGNRRMHQLNRRFRNKNKPTDVLSFPGGSGGDIAISLEIAAENALRFDHKLEDELKVLVLHGLLHLAGHDHEHDDGEMARLEEKLRTKLGLEGTLILRSIGAAPRHETARRTARGRSRT